MSHDDRTVDNQPTTEHKIGGEAHGSFAQYKLGLILSFVLTIIPFLIAGTGVLSTQIAVAIILICAVAQLLVQMILFLHMNGSSEQMWNVSSAIYVVFIVAFLIVGSMWIFDHLHHNMLMGH